MRKLSIWRSVIFLVGKQNKIIMTHDLGKVYYESKYSSRSLGLFLRSPLVELRPFADAYPAEFLRGLFSADGCADVCTDNGCLRLQIVLGNSNPELLGLVTSLLQSHFQLHSNTYLRKRKGATWKNGSKTVFLRKDAYALQIQRSMMCECSLMRLVS